MVLTGRVYDESRRVQTLLGEPLLCLGDRRAPQRLDQLGSFEQARELVLGRPVADVRVVDKAAEPTKLSKAEYEAGLEAAGFADISVEFTHEVGDGMHGAIVKAVKPVDTTRS